MLSVLKFSSSKAKIIFHTDCLPDISEEGDDADTDDTDSENHSNSKNYFKQILKIAGSRLIIQQIKPYKVIWEHVYYNKSTGLLSQDVDLPSDPVTLGKIVHISDVYRIFLLLRFGGIYLDDDMLLLKSHEQFFKSEIPLLAEESEASLANGFMMAPRDSIIFKRWLLEYKFYKNIMMGPYSVMKIWGLKQAFPNELTAIKNKWVRPNWREQNLLFEGYFDWSENFNVHMNNRYIEQNYIIKNNKRLASLAFERAHSDVNGSSSSNFTVNRIKFNEISDIDCLPGTFGEILRYVVYGESRYC